MEAKTKRETEGPCEATARSTLATPHTCTSRATPGDATMSRFAVTPARKTTLAKEKEKKKKKCMCEVVVVCCLFVCLFVFCVFTFERVCWRRRAVRRRGRGRRRQRGGGTERAERGGGRGPRAAARRHTAPRPLPAPESRRHPPAAPRTL